MATVDLKDWYTRDAYDVEFFSEVETLPCLWREEVATVEVYKDGKTQPGWSEAEFIRNYWLGRFNRVRDASKPFAYLMRAFSGFVIDIDGKNGGIESAKQLNLPPTLAETSKSGNGYHLWYAFPEEYADWSTNGGFDALRDRLSVVPGVDLKAVGCVYHYPQQRWNSRGVRVAPQHLMRTLTVKSGQGADPKVLRKLVDDKDEREIKRLIDDAMDTLSRPIPQGRRNQTLFAVGSRLHLLGYETWKDDLFKAGQACGLAHDEICKIASNVIVYADR